MRIETLSMQRGRDIKILDNLYVHHPKLSEIEELGLSQYRLYISVLTCGRIEYADILWCEKQIWYEDIQSDWIFFLNQCFGGAKESDIVFDDNGMKQKGLLIVPIYRDALNYFLGLKGEYLISLIEQGDTQQTILYNVQLGEDGLYHLNDECIKVSEMVYNSISDILRKMNWINRDFQFLKGGNKKAKKYILTHDYQVRKKNKKSNISFEDIISFLNCKTCDYEGLWKLPIYMIYDSYFRFNKINNYQDMLNKQNAGCIDNKTNPINWDKINWASSLE